MFVYIIYSFMVETNKTYLCFFTNKRETLIINKLMITGFISLNVSDYIRCNHGNSGMLSCGCYMIGPKFNTFRGD